MKINWMRYRKLYFAISAVAITIGVYSLLTWGLNLGVDFKGGTVIDYNFEKTFSTEEASVEIENMGFDVTAVQQAGDNIYSFKLTTVEEDKRSQIANKLKELTGGSVEELRSETVGPSFGPELVKKTLVALVLSATVLLFWIAYQFKSIKFGLSAVLAMLHDSLVVVGLYALLGHLYGAEADFLFVTAVLTILSFSVHDTIVVYDRIRELKKKHGTDLKIIANKALSETMRRSINNSLTIIFMLVALIVLGGTSIRWFAVALLIGTISGTYSSPFVAVPILVTWDELAKKKWLKR